VAERYYSWDVAVHQLTSLYEACLGMSSLEKEAGAGCPEARSDKM